ncbi:hypothetical protein [Geodermatophilus sp. CPCC 205761]|uniref:hypothetical protein n=1 Tax=Geodermatophilus sp. CPCC 205761 TaxID=2936597 RepID=UPI003EEFDEDC
MEPLTTILSALALGASAGLTDTVTAAVGDAYRGLKGLVLRAFDRDNVAQASLTLFESKPNEPVYVTALGEHLERHQVASDNEVVDAAKNVLRAAGPAATGEESIASTVASVWADRGSVAAGVLSGNVTINNQGSQRESDRAREAPNPQMPDQDR